MYKAKINASGEVVRYKARLVARGFSQVHGLDYYETFSPVTRLQSFPIILAIVAARKLKMTFFDVTTVFLNRDSVNEVLEHKIRDRDR